MCQVRILSRCIVVLASLAVAIPMARAQMAEASAAVPTASDKAQRKAESKARRAQKNAELSDLKKHGYNAAGAQATYPQNVQNAERKRKPATVGGPASTP
ncbi:hypothetical protein [Caballeronia sp. J97]|uniref:hypothetical protein n=1 Tax=Caballeronia sp. J97 TaxID=2805429 RepID=UPI002AB1901E|nr:hypothetical protein [Caballeronia sp. J97]